MVETLFGLSTPGKVVLFASNHLLPPEARSADLPDEPSLGDLFEAGSEALEAGLMLRHAVEGHAWVPGDEKERWVVLGECLAALGETALTANAAFSQAEALAAARSRILGPSAYGASLIFLLEGVGQYLIGCGHLAANLALRFVAALWKSGELGQVPPDAWQKLMAKVESADERTAWLFHSQVAKLKPSWIQDVPLPAAIDAVAALYENESWQELDQTRGREFHRLGKFRPTSLAEATTTGEDWNRIIRQASVGLACTVTSIQSEVFCAVPRLDDGTPILGPRVTVEEWNRGHWA